MDFKDSFDIFVGCKSGAFKGVKINKKEYVAKNIQKLNTVTERDRVTTMSWGDDEEKEILIACGAKGVRSMKVYDTVSSVFPCSFFCNIGEGNINGISRYDGAILTAVQSGEVKLWRFKKKDEIVLNAGSDLCRMRHSKVKKNIIATGGKNHKLKLFDLERQAQTFIEKELPHDWLQLSVPIWISDIDFLPGTQHIVTASRYGHVRLYDPNAQRRPMINIEMKDEALTTLAVTPREKQIIVGSGKGRMNLIDLRKPGKILNTYKGYVGGITGIACSTSEPYIVSVGLDRYLQIHHMDTKKLIKKVFLTSQLTCLLLRSGFSLATADESCGEGAQKYETCVTDNNNLSNKKETQGSVDSDTEYDMLFDKMQVVGTKENKNLLVKKKRKTNNVSDAINESTSDIAIQRRSKGSLNDSKKLKFT